jgi:DNA invertase Pin-like site-specific DNA recombinase
MAAVGAKGQRRYRPEWSTQAHQDILCCRREFDIVMAWSIDRLGRSLIDLLHTVQNLEAYGVDLYLDQRAIDTTTPAGKLMFQITGAFAEFERSMIQQRVRLGLKRAVAQGKQLGRTAIDSDLERKAQRQLRKGIGILKVAEVHPV